MASLICTCRRTKEGCTVEVNSSSGHRHSSEGKAADGHKAGCKTGPFIVNTCASDEYKSSFVDGAHVARANAANNDDVNENDNHCCDGNNR